MQLFDDLEDFGSFDDAVSGDVRDPYTGLAAMEGRLRHLLHDFAWGRMDQVFAPAIAA